MPSADTKECYRIGFVISSLEGGGAESAVLRWTETLMQRGHSARIYTYKPGSGHTEVPREVEVRQFRGRSRLARAFGLPLWIRRRARADELDVLVAVMTYANIAAALSVGVPRLPGLSLLICEQNITTVALPLHRPGLAAVLKRLAARMLYRRADGAIGISHPVAAHLVASFGLDPSRVFAVPNPITNLSPPPPEVPQASLTVAFVGRIVEQKKPLLFVDALAALSRRDIEVRGLVIGDGPLRSEMASHAQERSVELSFLGWRVPWWELDPRPDCLLLASSIEGLANVLVEAAAAGIPVVARSNALGTADAVVPGVTGELALGESPERLAAAVIRAVGHRGSRDDPISSWLGHFSVERSTGLLLETIETTKGRRS